MTIFTKKILCYDVSTLPKDCSLGELRELVKKENLCTYNSSTDLPGGMRDAPRTIEISCSFKEWLKSTFYGN